MDTKYIKERFDLNHKIISQFIPQNDSLFAGRLGLSYYYGLLHQVSGTEESENKDTSLSLLEDVLADFYESRSTLMHATFTAGAAGLGYTICYLNSILDLGLDVDDDLRDLDEYIFSAANNLLDRDNLDCLHGAGGIVFYFTQRGHSEYLNKLVPNILEKGIAHEHGIWFQNIFMETSEYGMANLSISHGMAGLLIILMKAVPYLNPQHLITLKKAVKESIRFIDFHYSPVQDHHHANSFYPQIIRMKDETHSYRGRLAWCYGDLGIALLFYQAGKFLRHDHLIHRATEIGIQTLSRISAADSGINEPFFCHGSAGLSSFYYTLYLESGDERYLQGMDIWMKKTVEYFDHNEKLFTGSPHEVLDGLIGVNISILEYLNRNTVSSFCNIFFL